MLVFVHALQFTYVNIYTHTHTHTHMSYTQDDGHTDWVSCVRFSPNAQNPVIVSCGWDMIHDDRVSPRCLDACIAPPPLSSTLTHGCVIDPSYEH